MAQHELAPGVQAVPALQPLHDVRAGRAQVVGQGQRPAAGRLEILLLLLRIHAVWFIRDTVNLRQDYILGSITYFFMKNFKEMTACLLHGVSFILVI